MLFRSAQDAQRVLTQRWRWPHFSIQELNCRCAGRYCMGSYWHAPEFLDALEAMRLSIGQPLAITSGHRCAQWNAVVGGTPMSQHRLIAADISLHRHKRQAVLRAARDARFTGLGLARTFLHVDQRAVPALWYYKGSKSLWQI